MQTSFIPKKPIVESRPEGSGISLFLLLAIIIFIVSLALVAGVYMWRTSLLAQIETDKQELVKAKDSYEEGTILPLIRLSDRIQVSQNLLNKHIAVSPIFTKLEENVLRNIQLKSLKFSYGAGDKIKIDLAGTARSYDALLKQSDAFGDQSLRSIISEPVISDFSPLANGDVSFNFNAYVNSNVVLYSNTAI